MQVDYFDFADGFSIPKNKSSEGITNEKANYGMVHDRNCASAGKATTHAKPATDIALAERAMQSCHAQPVHV